MTTIKVAERFAVLEAISEIHRGGARIDVLTVGRKSGIKSRAQISEYLEALVGYGILDRVRGLDGFTSYKLSGR